MGPPPDDVSTDRTEGGSTTGEPAVDLADASPADIEREIEHTREELAGTMSEIGQKVGAAKESLKPGQIVRRPGVQQAAAKVAVGAAFLVFLRSLRRRHRRKH